MGCPFCDMSPSRFAYMGKFWNVVVDKEQHYLGKHLIILNRHAEDVFSLSEEEMHEVWDIARMTTKSIGRLYKPDKFNFAFLMNNVAHVHLHVYPRYKEKRTEGTTVFEDGRFGRNIGEYEKKEMDDVTVAKMTEDLKNELDKDRLLE